MDIRYIAELALLNLVLGACLVAYLRLKGAPKTKRQLGKYGGVILMLFVVGIIFAITPFVSHQSPYAPDKPFSTPTPTNHLPTRYFVVRGNFAGQSVYLAPGDQQYCTLNGAGDMALNFQWDVSQLASGDELTVTYCIQSRDEIPFMTDWWFRIEVGTTVLYQGWSMTMTTLKFNDLAGLVHNGVLSVTLHGHNMWLGLANLGWGMTIDAVVLKY